MNAVYGTVQFRYLPSFLIIWYPLTLVDISTSFCIFNGICICLNVISAFYVIRIVEQHFNLPMSRTTKHFMSLILLGLFQAWNYGLGQVMALVLFFVITSLYYFLEGKTAIAGFLLGFSIVVKPVLYFTIFFVVLSAKNIRGKVKAIIAILPSFIVDCIIFLVFPTLLSSLLSRNTADFTFWRIYGSTSLSSLLYLDFNLDPMMVFLGVSIAVVITGLLVLKRIKDRDKQLVFSFVFGMLGFMVSQLQVWSHNLLVLFPLVFVGLVYTNGRIRAGTCYLCSFFQMSIVCYVNLFISELIASEPWVQLVNVSIELFITFLILWIFVKKNDANQEKPGFNSNIENIVTRSASREVSRTQAPS